jgi:hypothetical protein
MHQLVHVNSETGHGRSRTVGIPAPAAFHNNAAVGLIVAKEFFAGAAGKGFCIGVAQFNGGLLDVGGDFMQQLENFPPLIRQQNLCRDIDLKNDGMLELSQHFSKSGRPCNMGWTTRRLPVILTSGFFTQLRQFLFNLDIPGGYGRGLAGAQPARLLTQFGQNLFNCLPVIAPLGGTMRQLILIQNSAMSF